MAVYFLTVYFSACVLVSGSQFQPAGSVSVCPFFSECVCQSVSFSVQLACDSQCIFCVLVSGSQCIIGLLVSGIQFIFGVFYLVHFCYCIFGRVC